MDSRWNDQQATAIGDDPKALRVYTSRLLGSDPDLVLHGGGNTSVKLTEKDFFGASFERVLKSWDMKVFSFEKPEEATDLLAGMREFAADSIVAITNTPDGEERIRECFGDRLLIIPYVMPGFVLARKIFEMTRGLDWSRYEGMVLMNHGLFTFADDARPSYENTIELVSQAEHYLASKGATPLALAREELATPDLARLANLRKEVAEARKAAVVCKLDSSPAAVGYARLPTIAEIGTRGPVTPDHSIRTKRIPMILAGNVRNCVQNYVDEYKRYFARHATAGLTCLEPSPRWAIAAELGLVAFGTSCKEATIIADIAQHTAKVVQQAETLGGWTALSAKDVFAVEYWELEQAKLKQQKVALPLQGKIALVTGAASGIGKAVTEQLHADGAAVIATDIDANVCQLFRQPDLIGRICDVCDPAALKASVEDCVRTFGGIDIVVSNAGMFSQGHNIADLDDDSWQRALQLNLTQHKNLLQQSIPFLKFGIDPTFILVGTKNVAAPGPGAAAYSVSKAAANQLMRVAALELGPDAIRINTIHPDCVFDTGLWDEEVLKTRAKKYGMSVEEYKTRNVLKRSVTSTEVARLVSVLAGPTFAKTTGAQIPIDGGNERVI